jgi:hypothetical protein
MRLLVDDKAFKKDMKNIINYSLGYLDGVHAGKTVFFGVLGKEVIELLKEYVDSNARVNPAMLQHMYEWNMTGSPNGRLFDIDYTISNLGLSIRSTFRQSTSVKDGSSTPFYDKAKIMENGIPVTIVPKRASVLYFTNSEGEQVFSRGPIEVDTPGGPAAQGSFEKTFDTFFNRYFTQAFLRSSGIAKYLETPVLYKKNLGAGKRSGRSAGVQTGYRWIANAGLGN